MNIRSLDNRDLLDQSYPLIQWSLSKKGKFKINRIIQSKVERLKQDYGLEHDEILNSQCEQFLGKKIYRNYDQTTSKSTFIVHCTNYGLNREIRKLNRQKKNYSEVSLEEFLPENSDDQLGSSLGYLEKLGITGLYETDTPEDLCIAKELLGIILDHFGKDDTMVLLGIKDRRDEAERLSIKYHTYCKRLKRKVQSFIPILKQHGYLN